MEIATFGGGCFWCTEAIFKRLKGVASVTSGYSGGTPPAGGENPTYEQVSSGNTGHAETIQVEFDPSILSFEKLVEIFFHLHDPTTLNQQGNDTGTQYRSAIFYHSEEQKEIAQKLKKQLEDEHVYKDPIVTEITPFTSFYKAEGYHQNYYDRNSDAPYCKYVIDPKLQKLLKEYSSDIKS